MQDKELQSIRIIELIGPELTSTLINEEENLRYSPPTNNELLQASWDGAPYYGSSDTLQEIRKLAKEHHEFLEELFFSIIDLGGDIHCGNWVMTGVHEILGIRTQKTAIELEYFSGYGQTIEDAKQYMTEYFGYQAI